MASWQSRLLLFVLKNRHILQFRKKETSVDWNTSIEKQRQNADRSSGLLSKLPPEIELKAVKIGNLAAEWIALPEQKKDRVILYFHGGGYVMGSIQGHRAHVAKFVKGSGVAAFLFDYRLAPEHPFPGAVEDAVAAYRYLLAEGVSPTKIAFAGDSAGGGLVLATLLALKDQNIPLPAGAVALSPWTDLACTGDSYRTKLKAEPLAPAESWTVYSKYYVGNNDPKTPWISPLYGDLRGMPPMLIYVGENEVLLDDSVRYAEKAQAAGVDVKLTVGEGLFHCYPICAPMFPEATQAMKEICTFIDARTKG